jgi:hypothetical protein
LVEVESISEAIFSILKDYSFSKQRIDETSEGIFQCIIKHGTRNMELLYWSNEFFKIDYLSYLIFHKIIPEDFLENFISKLKSYVINNENILYRIFIEENESAYGQSIWLMKLEPI